ncbi:hypothetical protein VK792_04860 [Mesobacterium sp. TK19101]|uniref:Uncharacterized protein n=1 Tax=Mesobacterium hydrothermale TaxID=3111907 RepID=A0ABU6HFI7_9RHOB|nr:hypothetical protein [Mesobacterium sp. TK19101]MEC3860605.1 hypothetical protein [Mesobacterium sp. TK19101]
MSNVVVLPIRRRTMDPSDRIAALATCFATGRRRQEDVFWLKENAELLNVLETTRLPERGAAISAYEPFYASLIDRFTFFPQYYRFLLSICLDLEDLGLDGGVGARLAARAAADDLPGAELSDLQRAEARRLFERRDVTLVQVDPGLDDRLRAFAARTPTFALPNKKAAYELTHIVFYLSEYGRRDPRLPQEALTSLHYAGLLAWIDGNADLLAEVSVALRFANAGVPAIWETWLEQQRHGAHVRADDGHAAPRDDYHAWMMLSWHAALSGRPSFPGVPDAGRLTFHSAPQTGSILRELSQVLYQMDGRDRGVSEGMRRSLREKLAPASWEWLCAAEAATPAFGAFFETFVRAEHMPARLLRRI